MKKKMSITILLMMAVLLTACGTKETTVDTDANKPTEDVSVKDPTTAPEVSEPVSTPEPEVPAVRPLFPGPRLLLGKCSCSTPRNSHLRSLHCGY